MNLEKEITDKRRIIDALGRVISSMQRKLSNSVSRGQESQHHRYHYIPFPIVTLANVLQQIREKNPGKIKFIDFGCGYPFTLELAESFSMTTKGFEIDNLVLDCPIMNIFPTKRNVIKKDITKVTKEDLELKKGELLVCYFYVPICGPLQLTFEENLLKIIPNGTYIIGACARTLYGNKEIKSAGMTETYLFNKTEKKIQKTARCG